MSEKKTRFNPKRSIVNQAIIVALSTSYLITPSTVLAAQISPNPNDAGNTISVSAPDDTNDTSFDNSGTIDFLVEAVLTNNNTLTNNASGTLSLNDSQNALNFNALVNNSIIDNAGTIDIAGYRNRVANYGTLNNQSGGQVNVAGTHYNHLINRSGAEINNALGATISQENAIDSAFVYFNNQGTVNNDGQISLTSYLKNSGVITNNVSGQIDFIQAKTVVDGGLIVNNGSLNVELEESGLRFDQIIQNSASLSLKSLEVANTITNLNSGNLTTLGSGNNKVLFSGGNAGKLYNSGSWTHATGMEIDNQTLIQNEVDGVANIFGSIDNSGAFNNSGSLSVQSGASIAVDEAGIFTNDGIIKNYAGGVLSQTSISQGTNNQSFINNETIDNSGTLDVTGIGNRFLNYGTLNNQSGGQINLSSDVADVSYTRIINKSGGVLNNQAGASISQTGSGFGLYLDNQGTLNNDGLININQYFSNSDIVNNNLSGQINLTKAFQVTGSGIIFNQGTLNVELNLDETFSQRVQNSGSLSLKALDLVNTITNLSGGSLTTLGSGNSAVVLFASQNSGKIYNSGSWTHAAGMELENQVLIQNEVGGVLNLAGSINNQAAFTNAGNVAIANGGTIYGSGTFTQSAGTTQVNGSLAADGGLNFNGGLLSGDGQITLASNELQIASNATVNPGVTVGTLTVNGSVSFDGQLLLEINASTVGSYDVLTATSDIDFGVNANAVIDFNFTVNSEFTVQLVNAGSLTNFANISYSAQDLAAGYTIILEQSGNNIELNVLTDTDGDGIPNETDTDDDGDGVLDVNDAFPLDASESVDTDADGIGNNADTDDDGDGVADDVDAFPLDSSETTDTDGDGTGNNADTDDDGDGVADDDDAFPLDSSESVDTDGDGTGNNADADDDGDGVADEDDAFPLDSSESVDTDGDGTGNNADTDDDGDGVADDDDAFPLDSSESVDTDGDGIGNNADTDDDGDGVADTDDAFPLDSSESVDTDGDGTGNNADTDDDGDGVADDDDAFPLDSSESVDTDGDGTGNNADTDDDGDGVADEDDAFPLDSSETTDTDGDGTGNNADTDDDGDGVADDDDAFPLDSSESVDTDGDGIGNNADTDDDGDGVDDSSDAFPLDSSETVDTDGDGIGNNADTDDDGDGVDDSSDAFPLDSSESVDTDGDGTGNNADTDDDGDGVSDDEDAFPLDSSESVDTDGDGVGNNADTDDDGDGVADTDDAFPLDSSESVDTDGDGVGNNADTDDDGDGVADTDDAFPLDSSESVDTDGDGIGNNADTDDDGDGVADTDDAFPLDSSESVDTDGDGIGNNADTDDDGDGVPDDEDAFPLDDTESQDSDGDGIGDNSDPTPYPASGELNIESTEYTVDENSGTVTIIVTRSNGDYGDLTVDYSLQDGADTNAATASTDYTFDSGTLSFADGETSQSFSVAILDDSEYEGDETFTATISNIQGGDGTIGSSDSTTITIIEDEAVPPAGVVGFEYDSDMVNENDGSISLNILRTDGSFGELSVSYATSDGSAVTGTDYTMSSSSLTFADGETTKTVVIDITDDSTYESDESFTVQLSNLVGDGTLGTSVSTITILDDEPTPSAGVLEIENVSYSVNENDGSLSFNIIRTSGDFGDVGVDVSSADLTATSGEDYQSFIQTLTFADGEVIKSVTLTITDDTIYEGDEQLNINLSNVIGTSLGNQSTSTVTIVEDDEVPPAGIIQFSGASYSVNENAGSVLVTVTRANGNFGNASVNIDVTTVDGTAIADQDYLASTETLTFLDGETSQTISITILDDVDYEGDENFNVVLSNVVGDATLGNPASATVTIVEDDAVPPAGIVQFSGASYSVSEGDGTLTVTVQRTEGNYGDGSVDYSFSDGTAVNGSDYSSTDGTLYFSDGEISQTITITINEDSVDEVNETFNVSLSNPSNVSLGSLQSTTVSIVDNDERPVTEPQRSSGGGALSYLWLLLMALLAFTRASNQISKRH